MPEPRIRHKPEDTVLYRVVRDHLDGFLRAAREHGELPGFIEKTFRAFLDCGILERGMIRLHCAHCGHDDAVAFSCKKRGVCASCAARAMADGASHLVDHVLPDVPYRQWVVSFPFELNGRLAFQPELLSAVERLVMNALNKWQRARGDDGQPGGLLVRHRFGSTINLHVHSHVIMMDGVYRKNADSSLTFVRTPEPTPDELRVLATTLRRRIHALFKRRGLLRTDDDVSNLPEQLDALGACMNMAMTHGQRERRGPALSTADEDEVEQPRGGRVARVDGLNLYASSAIPMGDRELLEKLCRYVLRGPISLARLKQRDDGRLTYRLKKADRRGNTVLVMAPQELLMRIASLIPAPRHPTRRYFGILAAGARDRKAVVPLPTQRKSMHCADDDRPKPPVQSPVKWSELLKRVWDIDALDCPRCHGRMTPMAIMEDRGQIARYLKHMGQSTVFERARGPPFDDAAETAA